MHIYIYTITITLIRTVVVLMRGHLSLCGGILAIETSLSCGVLAIKGHNRPLVNYFSAFSDEPSLMIAKLPVRYPTVGNRLNMAAKPT
jgi:hypothetical protein